MSKLMVGILALLTVVLGLPVLAGLVVTMGTQAAAECRRSAALSDAGAGGGTAGDPARRPAEEPSADEVLAQVMRLRFAEGYPTLTEEQARNAITIAQVSHDLKVPRFGLQVAIATAIQESKLINLTGGDADSGGLFQQRPSTGWGSRAEVTTPTLAARAFFGRAKHTNNPGLLDVTGWEQMPLTEAASTVQRPREDLGGEYAQWETIAGDITDVLGRDPPTSPAADNCPSGATTGCPPTGSPAEKGLTPDALLVLRSIDTQFGSHTYLGVGERATNPTSDHPAGRAVDVMIDDWQNETGSDHGSQIAEWVRENAEQLGVSYVIWRAKIWSAGDKGWSSYTHPSGRDSPTLAHMDHVHISVHGTHGNAQCASTANVVYPIPANLINSDRHNWRQTGPSWSSWHSGTDFSVPCGTPVYAAHAGTIEIDTAESWSGRWLVKVTTGASSLSTWYAHMHTLTVSRGQTVSAGQQIGTVGGDSPEDGNSSGCHLHFEVHESNGPIYGADNVAPSQWLANNTGNNTGDAS